MWTESAERRTPSPQPARAALTSGTALEARGTRGAHVGWPEQMMGSPWCRPRFKETKMHLGAPYLEFLSRFQTVTRRRFCSSSSCTGL